MAQTSTDIHKDGKLSDLEQRLDYCFDDPTLLERALTHRSYANEHRNVDTDNQRLEFLGDAVLGVVIAEAVFRGDEAAPEGELSRQLSDLVCEPALVDQARNLKLGRFLRLGRGEEMTGGRQKEGLLADAYEAVLGAIFLDGGHEKAREVIRAHFQDLITGAADCDGMIDAAQGDYKSLLQREVQRCRPQRPEYCIVETSGPPHDRRFVAHVVVSGEVVGRGKGRSKKEAEQNAAAEAVASLGAEEGPLYRILHHRDDETNQVKDNP